jgi:hypothetical protein
MVSVKNRWGKIQAWPHGCPKGEVGSIEKIGIGY